MATQPNEDQLLTPEDRLYLAGLEPQGEFAPEQFQGGNFSERLAGVQGFQHPAPTSFGEGLLYGAVSGLGAAGSRVAAARAKFDESERQRHAAFDKDRLEASRNLRTETGKIRREREKEKSDERKTKEKFESENYKLTANDISEFPNLARVAKDGYVPRDWMNKALEERDKRLNPSPSEKRAEDRADREARNSEMNNINKLSDNFRSELDVKDFPTVRDAYNTGINGARRGNSAGDIILMRMIAKTTDPTTGVREEEFKTFKGAQGILNNYGVRLTTDMWGGGQLTPQGRAELANILQDIYDRKAQRFGFQLERHSQLAKRHGYDPNDIVFDYRQGGDIPKEKKTATVTSSNGTVLAEGDYKAGGFFDKNRRKK